MRYERLVAKDARSSIVVSPSLSTVLGSTTRPGEGARQLGSSSERATRIQTYAVDIVAAGDTAIVQAAVNEYDAVVLDGMMPSMTASRFAARRAGAA